MKDKYFLDTNIFVYSFDTNSPKKQKVANSLIQNALKKQTSCTSSQVIQEFINVATQKFKPPLTHEDCRKYMDFVLTPLCEAFVSKDA